MEKGSIVCVSPFTALWSSSSEAICKHAPSLPRQDLLPVSCFLKRKLHGVARSSICPSAPFCGWNVHLSPHFHSSSDPCPEHFCLLPPRPPLELSPASESLVANFFLFLSFLFFLFLLRPVWINKDHLSPLMWTLWLSCG